MCDFSGRRPRWDAPERRNSGVTTSRARGAGPLEVGTVEKISGDKVKRPITVKVGIVQDKAKQIQKLIKDSKMKVAASIQGDAVRVSGAKRDDLQVAIQLVKKSVADLPLQYINFRD